MWSIILFSLALCLPLLLWPSFNDCCCAGLATCDYCDGVPDYWEIEFTGIADQTETDCNFWNDITFRVCPVSECVWSCTGPNNEVLTLTVYLDGTDYKIKVGASLSNNTDVTDHVWEKNYGTTKPTCSTLVAESLTHLTDTNANCASGGSSCLITAKTADECSSLCTVGCTTCDPCLEGTVTDPGSQFQLTFAGLTSNNCTCADHNQAYTVTIDGFCAGSLCIAGDCAVMNGCDTRLSIDFGTGTIIIYYIVGIPGTTGYQAHFEKAYADCIVDCSTLAGLDIPLINQIANGACTVGTPTCTLTSL